MRSFLTALAFGMLAMLSGAPAASAQGAGINRVWLGYYGYNDGRADRVQFQLKLRGAGEAFTGTTIEPNTFGSPNALFLTANVAGKVAGDAVMFKKTYDGTGGQSHSVDYVGVFDATHRCIAGTWRIGDATGPFKVCTDAGLVS